MSLALALGATVLACCLACILVPLLTESWDRSTRVLDEFDPDRRMKRFNAERRAQGCAKCGAPASRVTSFQRTWSKVPEKYYHCEAHVGVHTGGRVRSV